ncbi:hypothetical protein GKR62_12105, partial [Yersinia pseudotuberculosis]|nr:hypothetical protein [Yersinia pseudotuberculosis]
AYMDVFTASLRSACSLRRGHFVNNLRATEVALSNTMDVNQHILIIQCT